MRLFPVAAVMVLLSAAGAGCLADVGVIDGETWFTFGDAGLLQEQTSTGTTPLLWGWPEYFSGTPPPDWRSGAFDDPAYITEATLEVRFVFDNAMSTEGPLRPFSRPQLTSWIGLVTPGGQESIIAHEFADGPTFASTGHQDVTWELQLPPAGLYVPAGSSLIVKLGSYMLHDGGVAIAHEHSRLDITMSKADRHERGGPDGWTWELPVAGGACMLRDPSGNLDGALLESASNRETFLVEPGHSVLEVMASAPYGDMDFFLLDPEGEEMAHALGPGGTETLLLGPENLAGRFGTWTAIVYACSAMQADVTLQVQLFE